MNLEEFLPSDLDVQKAVVESLAADKAEQDVEIGTLQKEISDLRSKISKLEAEKTQVEAKVAERDAKIEEMRKALENVGDVLAKNSESEISSKVALLERDPEIDDRFLGETRDQVLEVIKEARDAAEKDGRIRRAQLLESVLLANEPIGNLAKKRAALEKFFNENANIVSGPVIDELTKCGISYKNGEEYLLPSEILKRTY